MNLMELLDQWCRTVLCHLIRPVHPRGIIMDPLNLDRRTVDVAVEHQPRATLKCAGGATTG